MTDRILTVARRAYPGDPATHLPMNTAVTRRILAAAMTAAEASGELPSEFLMRAAHAARDERNKETP